MDETAHFGRILGFLKSTNPKSSGVYLFTIGNPTWPDAEGATAAVASDATQVVPVAWLGPDPPVADRAYVLHPCGNRLVAASGKPATPKPTLIVLAGCQCPGVPETLYMRPNDPILNGGMFKNCTLFYGPTDPAFARLALGDKCFMSLESFVDQIDQTYWYFFSCVNDKFTITRIYKTSIFGTPYRDSVRFTWTIGAAGNTCDPFLLTSGNVYQGGDTRSQITITPTGP